VRVKISERIDGITGISAEYRGEGHINHDGTMSACCFGPGAKREFVMADLTEVDFMTGWNSLAYQKLRAAHLSGDVTGTVCEGCAAGS